MSYLKTQDYFFLFFGTLWSVFCAFIYVCGGWAACMCCGVHVTSEPVLCFPHGIPGVCTKVIGPARKCLYVLNEDDSLDGVVLEIQENIFSYPVYTPLTERCVELGCVYIVEFS